jgi:hypothetical protein
MINKIIIINKITKILELIKVLINFKQNKIYSKVKKKNKPPMRAHKRIIIYYYLTINKKILINKKFKNL